MSARRSSTLLTCHSKTPEEFHQRVARLLSVFLTLHPLLRAHVARFHDVNDLLVVWWRNSLEEHAQDQGASAIAVVQTIWVKRGLRESEHRIGPKGAFIGAVSRVKSTQGWIIATPPDVQPMPITRGCECCAGNVATVRLGA